MKVLHILAELKFSGAEVMYVAAAKEFQKLGCELSVVNTAKHLGGYSSFFERAGYEVLHWQYEHLNMIQKIKYYNNVISYIRKNKIDVVHIHRSDMKYGMSYCAWMAGAKPVYTFHAIFYSHWYSYLYHVWLRLGAKHLFGCDFQTISDSVYEHEINYYHNKTTKVCNWYNTDKFYPAEVGEKETIRESLNISNETLVIISVGGCCQIKRHDDVIKAIAEIKKQNSNVLYLHLGDGESLDDEIELSKSLGVYSNIKFLGNQVDVRKFLIASDIYVMTSKHEGISLTTIEALSCKIPAVLYNVPGLKDFNRDQICSILIPEDYHILADNILKLYVDKKVKEDISTKGLAMVNEKYNMKKQVCKIFNLYR